MIILPANTIIDEEVLDNFEKNNILDVSCLYINELDKGPYISTTLEVIQQQIGLKHLLKSIE